MSKDHLARIWVRFRVIIAGHWWYSWEYKSLVYNEATAAYHLLDDHEAIYNV